jgi:ribulose-bisphosphate carboxylase large chain
VCFLFGLTRTLVWFLSQSTLCRNGKHVLVAYIMKPKAGYDYLATAAHFAAESSTGTNVNVCTTDDFTKSVDALVYYIDPDNEEMKIAYPTLLFDRNITDGRGMMCSFLTLAIGNNQGNSSPLGLLLLVPSLLFSGFVVLLCSSL